VSYRLNLSSRPVYIPDSNTDPKINLADKLSNIQFTAGYIQAVGARGGAVG